ncbi:MAG: DUF167 domain-containing protein [Alphaproteobacteria bacterium]|nr:DUF167 domain-containing protein [Alphaproteobacteria bacterium]
MTASGGWLRPIAGGVTVALKVQPKSKREGIEGLVPEAGGGARLKVRVKAPPDSGKANAAVIALLADAWGLRKSDIALIAGATERNKLVSVKGEAKALLRVIEASVDGPKPALRT